MWLKYLGCGAIVPCWTAAARNVRPSPRRATRIRGSRPRSGEEGTRADRPTAERRRTDRDQNHPPEDPPPQRFGVLEESVDRSPGQRGDTDRAEEEQEPGSERRGRLPVTMEEVDEKSALEGRSPEYHSFIGGKNPTAKAATRTCPSTRRRKRASSDQSTIG